AAAGGAEIVGAVLVNVAVRRLVRVDGHAADGILHSVASGFVRRGVAALRAAGGVRRMFALRSNSHRATRCPVRLTDRSIPTPGGIRSAQASFGERPQREIYNDPAGARAELEADVMGKLGSSRDHRGDSKSQRRDSDVPIEASRVGGAARPPRGTFLEEQG